MTHRNCPVDSMPIPLVAESERVRFYWCWSCQQLFAFVGGSSLFTAAFAEDESGGWQLYHSEGVEQDVRAAVVAVTRVPPRA